MAFANRFTAELPADPEQDQTPRQVHGAAFSWVEPTPVAQPEYLAWSNDMAQVLGITDRQGWLAVLAGNQAPAASHFYATAYGGHQFGHWAGQLGDGRAMSLGEWQAPDQSSWELQLKGAGRTPYSRGADGRAVLRSSLREFVCSEAMHHLGVPTTRALSLVLTGDAVERDMFYDGRPQLEPGAIVCRAAPSFIRFGHFQLPASRGDTALLTQWLVFTLKHHFPQFITGEEMDLSAWFRHVCELTADLMVHWLRVGFVHGVMNTDNMSIHGLTIDYGPYGWLEPFDPAWTPNTTDAQGRRYAFGRQAAIAQWNLQRLAEALLSLVSDSSELEQGLAHYAQHFEQRYAASFAQKLGLSQLPDEALLEGLFACMRLGETDYVLLFRHLAQLDLAGAEIEQDLNILAPAFYQRPESAEAVQAWQQWLLRWRQVSQQYGLPKDRRCQLMDSVNPLFVPRNYLLQQAIEAAEAGDKQELQQLMAALANPYQQGSTDLRFAQRRPDWARNKPGCSALSCSS